jgi:hypothetical protein
MIIFIQFCPNNWKWQLKKNKIKFASVTNDTAETNIKNHIYHYTTPYEMVICESDGDTDDYIMQW